jgi:hypothetical protein
MKKLWFLSWVLWLMVACTSLGLEQPKSLEDRLAYAYASNAAVRDASTSSFQVGALTPAEFREFIKKNDEVRAILDSAKIAVQVGDVSTAEGRLNAALVILAELQKTLHAKAGPAP